METIQEIREIKISNAEHYEEGVEGFEISTNKQRISLVISNSQQCCENWGYLLSHEDPQEFVGAELRDVILTNNELRTHHFGEDFEGSVIFIDLITNRGVLQFVAYNEHNGYYSHTCIIKSNQLSLKEML